MPATRARQANQKMVDRLIAEGTLWSPSLIQAFRHTPRHLFLERCSARLSWKWQETLVRDLWTGGIATHLQRPAIIARQRRRRGHQFVESTVLDGANVGGFAVGAGSAQCWRSGPAPATTRRCWPTW